MAERSCPDRLLFGALVMGEITGAEAAVLRQHAVDCPPCGVELAQLEPVVAALRKADPRALSADVQQQVAPDPALGRRIALRIRQERRDRRRRRWFVAAGAAAALILIVGIVGLRWSRTTTQFKPDRIALRGDNGGVANIVLYPKEWGTELHVCAIGLSPGEPYYMWLERPDGTRVPAGSFVPLRGREVTLVLSSALRSDQAAAVGMTEPRTKEEARIALR